VISGAISVTQSGALRGFQMVGHDQLAAYVEERRGERRHALNVVDTVPRPCRDPKSVARLRSSVVISGHHWSSLVINGHKWSAGVISGQEWSSEYIGGRHASSRSSEVIRGHQRPQWTSRGNLMQSQKISCNLVQSHACDSTTQRRTCPSVSSGRSVGSFDCTYARPSLERVGRR
jgi:hypothetical protein